MRISKLALITTEIVKKNIDMLETVHPVLVREALRRFDIKGLTRILRSLLDEEISIKDLRTVLEGLLAIRPSTVIDQSRYVVFFPYAINLCPVDKGDKVEDLDDYSDCVRMFVKRYISYKYTGGSNSLSVYLLFS
jgi:type III secretion protein V